mmetsp:Transcript_42428/g.104274  ORF Transcript_42428/g.104274 Transcript_42428/m.104274 type:complete len:316 (+) Transcript_42428:3-950(+)
MAKLVAPPAPTLMGDEEEAAPKAAAKKKGKKAPEVQAYPWTTVDCSFEVNNRMTRRDLESLVRMHLALPANSAMTLYFPSPKFTTDPPVRYIKDDKVARDAADLFTKGNSVKKLYVKNLRLLPPHDPCKKVWEDRDKVLESITGSRHGINWEVCCVKQKPMPPGIPGTPFEIPVGDAIIFELPDTCDKGTYKMLHQSWVSNPVVIIGPVEETIEPRVPKGKKKAPAKDPDIQLSFVAVKPGTCNIWVELQWEAEEEALSRDAPESLKTIPCPVDNVAQMLLSVRVYDKAKAAAGKTADKPDFKWWSGDKWGKKGK